MSILVQKFGGTSVESYEKMNEVCKIVKAYKKNDEELQLVLVVSAYRLVLTKKLVEHLYPKRMQYIRRQPLRHHRRFQQIRADLRSMAK